MTINNYLDLRQGNRLLVINHNGLESIIDVEQAQADTLALTVKHLGLTNKYTLKKGGFKTLKQGIAMYSYGSRGRGERIHIRLELRPDFRYELEKCQTTPQTQ